jgi:hypothetical protein
MHGLVLRLKWSATNIAHKLGLKNMDYKVSSWRYVPSRGSKDKGAQIDMIFDRSDGVISLVEIKYASDEFILTKEIAMQWKRKIDIFSQKTNTKKKLQFEVVTLFGMKKNIWSEGLVENVLTLKDLF